MNKKVLTLAAITVLVMTSFLIVEIDSYKVDVEQSNLKWTGYHLAKSYEHNGNVKLKSGSLEVKNGKILSGNFVIDMTTITNNDIEGEKNAKLVNHLKSDDFFNTEKFPEAKLVIKKVEGSKASGEVTIRDITEPIAFDIKIKEAKDDKVIASATLNIDRTKHEVSYGWTIENAMLSNEFKMEVKIIATK
ncbi:MAG: YceI family protein [Cyclobacteriaceae bacterium]|nr:YceI family protein [Cyclobacteriaceae bacterium]